MHILIVDDESALSASLRSLLESCGHSVEEQSNITAAARVLDKRTDEFDVVLLDLFFDGAPDGMQLLNELSLRPDAPPVIVMSGMGLIAHAVRALKMGARDYMTKPVDPEDLLLRLSAIESQSRQRDGSLDVEADCINLGEGRRLIAHSPQMKALLRQAAGIVEQDFSVLLQGETGVGKGLLARLLHTFSHRGDGPFISLNCSAIPHELAEAELFGHSKGAFTGATGQRVGLLQQADGGSIFLDEIGELSPTLQGKLLTALEDGQVRPIGAREPVSVDFRLIAATNLDLQTAVGEGRFRSDLYYRISTVTLAIAALRERPEDIEPLAGMILDELGKSFKRENLALTPAALRALRNHSWYGNVRELRNVLVRSIAASEHNVLDVADLKFANGDASQPSSPQIDAQADASDTAPQKPFSATRAVEDLLEQDTILPLEILERLYVTRVLEALGGNKVATARALKISRGTLRRKLRDDANL
ncbi:sigma-54-dependent transcriptional regulator [Acidihalobacter prosperus]